MSMDDYNLYKRLGVCPVCRKNNCVPGMVLCGDCLYNANLRNAKKDREQVNAQKRAYYAKWRSQGRCVECKKPAIPGQCRCERHAKRNRIRQRSNRVESARDYAGICRWCDKPVVPGRKYCEDHLKKLQELAQNATNARKEARKEAL